MPDNRRFRGRSQVNLGSLFGDIGGMMGGNDTTPVFGEDGKSIIGFKPKGSGFANFLTGGAGASKASEDTNALLLQQQEEAQRLATQKALREYEDSLAIAKENRGFQNLGDAFVMASENPGELDFDTTRLGKTLTGIHGNNLTKGFSGAELEDAINKAQIPGAAKAAVARQNSGISKDEFDIVKNRVDGENYDTTAMLDRGLKKAAINSTNINTDKTQQDIDRTAQMPYSPLTAGVAYHLPTGKLFSNNSYMDDEGNKLDVPTFYTPDGLRIVSDPTEVSRIRGADAKGYNNSNVPNFKSTLKKGLQSSGETITKGFIDDLLKVKTVPTTYYGNDMGTAKTSNKEAAVKKVAEKSDSKQPQTIEGAYVDIRGELHGVDNIDSSSPDIIGVPTVDNWGRPTIQKFKKVKKSGTTSIQDSTYDYVPVK